MRIQIPLYTLMRIQLFTLMLIRIQFKVMGICDLRSKTLQGSLKAFKSFECGPKPTFNSNADPDLLKKIIRIRKHDQK
jgi:hypothetical protein